MPGSSLGPARRTSRRSHWDPARAKSGYGPRARAAGERWRWRGDRWLTGTRNPRRSSPAGTRTRARRTCPRCRLGVRLEVRTLATGVLLALVLSPGRAGALRSSRRPARGCADRPEELLEQLYGRLAAGVLGAFQHTLQLGPREQARNASCPGGRPDRRFRPPTPLRSVSPWAYRLSYDPTRYPRLLPEAYCLCRGCLTGPRGEEDLSLRSAPVLLPTVVLRRTAGCAGGRSVYAEEYVAVPVGCTCVPAPDHDAPAAAGTDRGGKERNQDPGHEEWDRDLRRPFRSGGQ